MTSPSDCLVSVVVPCYNRLDLLKVTVASLLQQSESSCEFIFVDDRSDEDTWAFLTSITSDSRVRLLRKADGAVRGCQASRNLGLEAARGRYVMFLDSDDLLEEHCLRDRLEFARLHAGADIVVGRQAIFYERHGNALWVNHPKPGVTELDRFLHLTAPMDVPWVNGGCLLKADRLKLLGVRWRSEFLWDDVVFHIECLLAGMSVAWMPAASVPDSWYRQHGTEQFSQALLADGGTENVARMLMFLCAQVSQANELSELHQKLLLRSLFVKAILPALDSCRFSVARATLRTIRGSGYFPGLAVSTLSLYSVLRRVAVCSSRLTYWVNWIFRWILPDCFYGGTVGNYSHTPVDVSHVHRLLCRLVIDPFPLKCRV